MGIRNILVQIAHHYPRVVGIAAHADAIARKAIAEVVYHARSPQACVANCEALGEIKGSAHRLSPGQKRSAGCGNVVLIDAGAAEKERVIAVLCDLVVDASDVPVLANRGRCSKPVGAEVWGIKRTPGIGFGIGLKICEGSRARTDP